LCRECTNINASNDELARLHEQLSQRDALLKEAGDAMESDCEKECEYYRESETHMGGCEKCPRAALLARIRAEEEGK
jgi:hypothetical protein